MVRALQSVGEEKLIDLVLYEEYQKGATQVSLMSKYGITRNRLYKVITGTTRPGGSQYQQGLKRDTKGKSADMKSEEATIKKENIKTEILRGKGRGKSSKKK